MNSPTNVTNQLATAFLSGESRPRRKLDQLAPEVGSLLRMRNEIALPVLAEILIALTQNANEVPQNEFMALNLIDTLDVRSGDDHRVPELQDPAAASENMKAKAELFCSLTNDQERAIAHWLEWAAHNWAGMKPNSTTLAELIQAKLHSALMYWTDRLSGRNAFCNRGESCS